MGAYEALALTALQQPEEGFATGIDVINKDYQDSYFVGEMAGNLVDSKRDDLAISFITQYINKVYDEDLL